MKDQDLAAALGVSKARVSQMKAAGMPGGDLEAARAWRKENLQSRISEAGDDDDAGDVGNTGDYRTWRVRRERAEALRAERELRCAAGELVRADDVVRELSSIVVKLRDSMLAIPDRLAAVVAAEGDLGEVHRLMRAEIEQALRDFVGSCKTARFSQPIEGGQQ